MNELDSDKVEKLRSRIDSHADSIMGIVDEIIHPYCGDLDKYVEFIASCLNDGENPPTDEELDDFCLNLSTQLYFAGGMCEQLGIRDDISRAVYKEVYNTVRNEQTSGTIADKDSIAELYSQTEQLTSVCYTRAYKMLKAKIDAAQELLSSCKKVVSRRMTEAELTRIAGGVA